MAGLVSQLKSLAGRVQGLLITSRFGVSRRQRVQEERFGVSGVTAEPFRQPNRFNPRAKPGFGLGSQKPGQAVSHRRPTRVYPQRLPVMSNGLLHHSDLGQGIGQVGVSLGVVGVEADGPGEMGDGFFGLAHSEKHGPQVVVGFG